jgi:hypothetical protein
MKRFYYRDRCRCGPGRRNSCWLVAVASRAAIHRNTSDNAVVVLQTIDFVRCRGVSKLRCSEKRLECSMLKAITGTECFKSLN